jgi:phosphinothricin acetyltransferase
VPFETFAKDYHRRLVRVGKAVMPSTIRLARQADAGRIAAIYAPSVDERATSFETVAPDAAQVAERIDKVLARWPWLVWDEGDGVQGYAYAGAFADRACYQWSVTVSVYVDDRVQRRGVGRALYVRLFELLRRQGCVNAYAGITLPNDASIGLHRALGFADVGIYRRVGFKFGRWHDVAWLGLALAAPHDGVEPSPPCPLPDLLAQGALADLR